jgi:hypothetical protein
MNISWNGSDKKINILQDLYKKETGEEIKSFSNESYNYKVNISKEIPPKGTDFWYVENSLSGPMDKILEYYINIKKENNITNIMVKDLSYNPVNGYIHCYIDEFNSITYLKNEHEIDSFMVDKIVDFKTYASS